MELLLKLTFLFLLSTFLNGEASGSTAEDKDRVLPGKEIDYYDMTWMKDVPGYDLYTNSHGKHRGNRPNFEAFILSISTFTNMQIKGIPTARLVPGPTPYKTGTACQTGQPLFEEEEMVAWWDYIALKAQNGLSIYPRYISEEVYDAAMEKAEREYAKNCQTRLCIYRVKSHEFVCAEQDRIYENGTSCLDGTHWTLESYNFPDTYDPNFDYTPVYGKYCQCGKCATGPAYFFPECCKNGCLMSRSFNSVLTITTIALVFGVRCQNI